MLRDRGSGSSGDAPGRAAARRSGGQSAQGASSGGAGPSGPAIELPKGGGALRGIGESFSANPMNGTGSLAAPIATSPGRSGFGPELTLTYESGAGNGPFGLGWDLGLPAITRKTDKGLPRYRDGEDSDQFLFNNGEELVPVLVEADGEWLRQELPLRTVEGRSYRIRRYRPRMEGLFARIEEWRSLDDPADRFWRAISRDNVTSWYGRDAESRIVDPADPARIFSWLISESHDGRGNVISYGYKREESQGVDPALLHEANRTNASRTANLYPKRIRYGNLMPYFGQLSELGSNEALPADWMFELVFDYGEHDQLEPRPDDTGAWSLRPDPFSRYRAGFEIRSYRHCRRALMFHHFPGEAGVGADCLVRSTDFAYGHDLDPEEGDEAVYALLSSVTETAYQRQAAGGYASHSLPPTEFDYSPAVLNDEVRSLDRQSLDNLPSDLDKPSLEWADLDGEGLSGALMDQGGSWYYKKNLSPLGEARLAAAKQVEPLPSFARTESTRRELMDLAGDGQLDLVTFDQPTSGFFERSFDRQWSPFEAFEQLPSLDWSDPNLRFIDLTGDGLADILVTTQEAITWYPSLGERGFGPPECLRQALDEARGPRLLLADDDQSIHLADMSGDGLTDLVRIRNGEICYWPNLGYGRFGPKVAMDHAPWLDPPDVFRQDRVRLADVDGSGTADLIYLAGSGAELYLNRSGNSWSEARALSGVPRVDNLSSVRVFDLLGTGTACLVWSSPLPGDAGHPIRYVDLMGGQKPHLLVATRNGLGAETRIHYAPSTKFYLQDQLDGRPWITRLPFVVQLVELVEAIDHVSRNRFTTRYVYHHGYFDGVDREFRGFGMVEQWDGEAFAVLSDEEELPAAGNLDESTQVPPAYSKTWYHTGVYLGRGRVSNYFAGLLDQRDSGEYYREPGLSDPEVAGLLLPDTILPEGLSLEEEREACRALKGMMLRQEIFSQDGGDRQAHPYRVTERTFAVRALQPKAGNKHGVFFVHEREALDYHYERNPADPRTTHDLTLSVDDFGNVLLSASLGYGRRLADLDLLPIERDIQGRLHISLTERTFTNAVDEVDQHRTPMESEAGSYELAGLDLAPGQRRFAFQELLDAAQAAEQRAYHEAAAPGLSRRVLELVRTVYRRDDLADALPFAALQPLGLIFESYRLAFMPDHIAAVFGDRVDAAILSDEGHYRQLEGDDAWWIPSGRSLLSPGAADDGAAELAFAREHFYLPHRLVDPFGQTSFVGYDAFDYLVLETRDPLDNRVSAGERLADGSLAPGNDYRVLQPRLVTDANGNRSAVAYDVSGRVAGTALMGKPDDATGDTLEAFAAELSQDQVDAFLADPRGSVASDLLGNATMRIIQADDRFLRLQQPAFTASISRETHRLDLEGGQETERQVEFAFSDGFGRVIQSKTQAEPGPLEEGGPVISPRWTTSGWTVFNNKGNPVKQFEPFFSADHAFAFAPAHGVGSSFFYDPLGRTVAVLHPNHTWEKAQFDPWRQVSWDVNDTALIADPADDADVGDHFRRLEADTYLPTWHQARVDGAMGAAAQDAAQKTAAHAETPSAVHLDSLGRLFLRIADNGAEGRYRTRSSWDLEGNPLDIVDDRGNPVMAYQLLGAGGQPVLGHDAAGRLLYERSMDAGERRMLPDVDGKEVRSWDSRGQAFRSLHDPLQRQTHLFVRREGETEVLIERTLYGEGHAEAESLNLREQVHQVYDAAGCATNLRFDWSGNLVEASRRFARDYRGMVDWSPLAGLSDLTAVESAAEPLLETESFASQASYDALGRPVSVRMPDESVSLPSYNEAALLERVAVHLHGAADATPLCR